MTDVLAITVEQGSRWWQLILIFMFLGVWVVAMKSPRARG